MCAICHERGCAAPPAAAAPAVVPPVVVPPAVAPPSPAVVSDSVGDEPDGSVESGRQSACPAAVDAIPTAVSDVGPPDVAPSNTARTSSPPCALPGVTPDSLLATAPELASQRVQAHFL